jgi:hypothetical protein
MKVKKFEDVFITFPGGCYHHFFKQKKIGPAAKPSPWLVIITSERQKVKNNEKKKRKVDESKKK